MKEDPENLLVIGHREGLEAIKTDKVTLMKSTEVMKCSNVLNLWEVMKIDLNPTHIGRHYNACCMLIKW